MKKGGRVEDGDSWIRWTWKDMMKVRVILARGVSENRQKGDQQRDGGGQNRTRSVD